MFAICPCGTQKLQEECCRRFHDGEVPPNAELLMRSRYAAYAYSIPEYIINTTHESSPQRKGSRAKWRAEILEFSKGTQFDGLEIIQFIDGSTNAEVTFKARLTHRGRDASFIEKSTFVKEGDRWFYKGGEILKNPTEIIAANRPSRW